jgi:hypothetical protein
MKRIFCLTLFAVAALVTHTPAQEVSKFEIRATFELPKFTISAETSKPAAKCTNCTDCKCAEGRCPNCYDEKSSAKTAPPAPELKNWFTCSIRRQEGNTTHCGTGTPVWNEGGKTLIMTNAHVVPKNSANQRLTVGTAKGWYAAKYIDGSSVFNTGPGKISIDGSDLCLLEIEADLGAVIMASEPPAVGTPVGHFGFGGRNFASGPAYRGGQVVPNDVAHPYVRFSGTSVQGDSGAGIFNLNGEMVGVVWGEHYGVSLPEVELFCASSEGTSRAFPRFFSRMRERRANRLAACSDGSGNPAPASPRRATVGDCPNGTCPTAPPTFRLAPSGSCPTCPNR